MAKQEARFINRELSWLEFNQRVLDEALDESVPLLERLNFLAITASNLDEFFMVRVGGLQMLRDRNVRKPDPAGLTPRAQLAAIAERAKKMVEAQYRCYREQLDPALRAAGIRRVTPAEVTPMQARVLDGIFEESVFPVVTPVAVTADSRFPSLTNLRLHVAVRIKSAEGDARYAIIAVGDGMKRFLALPAESGYAYMTMEDLIRMRIDRLFPGEQVLESVPFRLTRNADIRVREDMAADFMMEMENVLDQRREGHGVRLEIKSIASRTLSGFLRRRLQVRAENVYEVPGPMDLSAFGELTRVDGFDELRYAPWSPQPSADVDPGRSIFDEMGEHDILLNHPYERFDPVLRLIEEASRDPDVLAI
ncbi:MAG: RNA degradosome polyphosphate kinase, partial [Lentisphaerae bacterium]|nr:RNA degradosome polyphosphate kinase [Lentisphaerota bacterium]